ncbi:hypothetical protein F5I97DRAFT_394010 [Phlebopus sp. FC_14]|nr:hypothetical protein F5I97DRAFT_394010 [Phlebopus sp. FC_14]
MRCDRISNLEMRIFVSGEGLLQRRTAGKVTVVSSFLFIPSVPPWGKATVKYVCNSRVGGRLGRSTAGDTNTYKPPPQGRPVTCRSKRTKHFGLRRRIGREIGIVTVIAGEGEGESPCSPYAGIIHPHRNTYVCSTKRRLLSTKTYVRHSGSECRLALYGVCLSSIYVCKYLHTAQLQYTTTHRFEIRDSRFKIQKKKAGNHHGRYHPPPPPPFFFPCPAHTPGSRECSSDKREERGKKEIESTCVYISFVQLPPACHVFPLPLRQRKGRSEDPVGDDMSFRSLR